MSTVMRMIADPDGKCMKGEQLGRELIGGEDVVLAQRWLRTIKSEVRRRVVKRL
jgi:hypothetical protein